MLWLSKHARVRNDLSAYIDGQLSQNARTSVEGHLAGCEACTRELEELRATISAVGALPEGDAPRSFAVTPELLGQRISRLASETPPVAIGMRLAGAAVAVALAVVVVGDLGVGGDGDGGGTASSGGVGADRASNLESASDAAESGEIAGAPGATSLPEERDGADSFSGSPPAAAQQGAIAACPAAADTAGGGTSGGTGGGGVGGPATSPVPLPEPTPTPSLDPAALAECEVVGTDESTANDAPVAQNAPAEPGDASGGEAAASLADDGGISAWTVLEIALVGALVALLIGIVAELLLRRRRAV
jgi:hypothetical protein